MTIHRLSPDVNWFKTPVAVSVAYREYFGKPGVLRQGPSRWQNAFSRLLRGLADWIAAVRERQAVLDQLSGMSDRDLADIGLSRAQIHAVFDPEFVQARDTLYRAASEAED
jgi:uncharacterized protein YjiS (DUF1127 family)